MVKGNSLSLLILGLLLILIGFGIDFQYGRPSISQMNNHHSSAFHGGKVIDPFLPINKSDYQTISKQISIFAAQVPYGTEFVTVKFLYQCDKCSHMWIELKSQPGVIRQKYLAYYAPLEKNNWLAINNGNLFLYQNKLRFKSLDEFFNSSDKISFMTEEEIAKSKGWNLSNEMLIENNFDINSEFILTSYGRSRIYNGWYEFLRKYHLGNALRDGNGFVQFETSYQGNDAILMMTKPDIRFGQ